MCIAIAKQAGVAIQEKILRTCFDNNPDGAGFCVEVDGKLIINKGYFTFHDFYTAFAPYENEKALIHFRIRTHGETNKDNCHPFHVTDDIAFIHNGIISTVHAPGKESDTIVFNTQYLQPLISKYGEEVFTSPQLKRLIEHFIGGSKLAVFVKGQEDFVFFNETLGNRSKEGIWFSNMSWQQSKDKWYALPPAPKPTPWKERKSFDTQPAIEVDQITTPSGLSFSFGTLVEVVFPINHRLGTIPKGAIGEVERVYSDNKVDVDFYIEGKVEKLYPYALKIVDDYSSSSIPNFILEQ